MWIPPENIYNDYDCIQLGIPLWQKLTSRIWVGYVRDARISSGQSTAQMCSRSYQFEWLYGYCYNMAQPDSQGVFTYMSI